MSSNYSSPSVQPEDSRTIEEAVDSRVAKRVKGRIEDDNQEVEKRVRELIGIADDALAGDSPYDAAEVLETIHYYLRHDDRLGAVLGPQNDALEQQTKVKFRSHMRLRDGGTTPPPEAEFKTAVKVAKALKYIYSYKDTTRYIPVRMEKLDLPGARSTVNGEPTPIGRRRIGKSQKLDETAEEVLINHDDCEHVLVVALPRKGKDSTIVNICGNLKDEHGYKWFSCLDDGRNETPMTAIPNDEPPIKDNLDQFNQHPKAYDSRVYVPDTDGTPDVLPSNFERFTIGIDTLTPRLILRLAGISTDDANTMRRIGQALEETQRRGLGVEQLVELLYEYSEEVEATITVTELQQDEFVEGDDGATVVDDAEAVEQDPSVREVRYEMDADDALEEVAESLLMLAGEGLIADPGAETNLDIVEEFKHQERVAVLNCNFLKPRNEGLKFVVLNLWLRLIFRARDDQPRLPRAALEIRELKDIAPSVLGNSKYKKEVKALQSTIYEIATRGGSRRILMLGSTQKLNDVYKPVRTNMPVKILLQLGEEEIMTLDRAYNFSPRQREQLTEFSVGQGMLMTNGEAHWPIQWRGARCGLGLGDETWRDRYAEAWGARVLKNRSQMSAWKREHADCEVYINARTGRLKPVDVENGTHPDLGEWFLLPEDLFEPVAAAIHDGKITPPETVDRRLVETALEARREADIPSDLGLRRVERSTERSLSFAGADEAAEEEKRQILSKYNVPKPLEGLIGPNVRTTRQNMLAVIEEIDQTDSGELTSMADLAEASGIPKGTIGRWRTNRKDFPQMLDKKNGEWVSTAVGQRALKINWRELDRLL